MRRRRRHRPPGSWRRERASRPDRGGRPADSKTARPATMPIAPRLPRDPGAQCPIHASGRPRHAIFVPEEVINEFLRWAANPASSSEASDSDISWGIQTVSPERRRRCMDRGRATVLDCRQATSMNESTHVVRLDHLSIYPASCRISTLPPSTTAGHSRPIATA